MTEKLPFTPWFGRVLLKRDRLKKVGSLLIPDDIQRRHSKARGVVVAIGEQCSETTKNSLGKTVLFGAHAGAWLDANGVECPDKDADFFLCNEDDILGECE